VKPVIAMRRLRSRRTRFSSTALAARRLPLHRRNRPPLMTSTSAVLCTKNRTGIVRVTGHDGGMPRISTFYGIVIEMYFDDHPPPHFHALYAGEEALIVIDTGEI
jgi:hypothetical protein